MPLKSVRAALPDTLVLPSPPKHGLTGIHQVAATVQVHYNMNTYRCFSVPVVVSALSQYGQRGLCKPACQNSAASSTVGSTKTRS